MFEYIVLSSGVSFIITIFLWIFSLGYSLDGKLNISDKLMTISIFTFLYSFFIMVLDSYFI